MIILQQSSSSQTFKFIPREYETSGSNIYNVSIVNETTNKNVYDTDTNSFTLEDYYYKYTDTFTLVQDTFYLLTIKKSGNVIFRDKIFCTNQNVTDYTVNYNEYDEQETTNEFIVL